MQAISPDDAIARARARTDVEAFVPAGAWRVRRLDRPGECYYLVVLGEDHAAVAVATVGAAQGEIQSWAKLPGQNPHAILKEREAIERAGVSEDVKAELVWKPCRATRSPFYPLWEIRTATTTLYVDQQGMVYSDLPLGGSAG